MDTIPLPTYEEDLPDVNPVFDQFANGWYTYPYTVRNNLTSKRILRHWRAIYLENEYLKCSVLPDVGGHLYSCRDKINGREMFYANPSLKKVKVGLRGAWVAFGVEFNFPLSHSWVSISPVDFAFRNNPDGSASATVGNIDRPYGMQWRVELVLRPGSTVLEQKVTLYNRGDQPRRYYWWTNGGVPVWDDSRILYPMRYTASHGFTDVDTWPVNAVGKDLSFVRNHTDGYVSRFVHGSREPFMGVYHPQTNAGVVHWADFGEVPGKKIWSCEYAPDGMLWRMALSDDRSTWVEVQAGLFRNQETYAFLPPHQVIRFTEYWMPVRELGGITRANLHGILNMTREAAGKGLVDLAVGLNANVEVPNARIRILDSGHTLFETRRSLTPSATFSKTLPGLKADRKYTFEIGDSENRVLLTHTEEAYDWTPASEIQTGRQPSIERKHDPVENGAQLERDGHLLAAWEVYRGGLAHSPDHFELNKAAGRLAITLKRHREAVGLLLKAQQRSSNDPEIHYYLGNAYAFLGEDRKARTEWEGAQRQPGFRPAARFNLARLNAREGDLEKALELIRKANAEADEMVRAGGMEIALLRRSERKLEAAARLDYWLEKDPTNSFLRHEGILLGRSDESLWRHLAADPERVLDIAIDYMELGQYEEAISLLERQYPAVDSQQTEPGAVLPQDYPLIHYYRGYCRERAGTPGAGDFDRASRCSTRYVFPNRAVEFPVLASALRYNPRDATARFLLASLYMSAGMVDEAISQWQKVRTIDPGMPVLHRNLGRTLLALKNDERQASAIFLEGLGVDRDNYELYLDVNQALALSGRPAKERAEALRRYPDQSVMPSILVFDFALTLAEAGQFEEAERLFSHRYFPRAEHGADVREVWVQVALLKAAALARAGNVAEARRVVRDLGNRVDGLEFTSDVMQAFVQGPRFEYHAGHIDALCGNPGGAREHWEKAARGSGAFAVMAAHRLGQPNWEKRAREALSRGDRPLDKALLLSELGQEKDALAAFRAVLRQTNRGLEHHIARQALDTHAVTAAGYPAAALVPSR